MAEIRRPKKPYGEHRREFAAARGLETNPGDPQPAESAAAAVMEAPSAPVSGPVPPRPSPAPAPERAAQAGGKLRLRFAVPAPAPGVSAYFDRAVTAMGEGRALRLVLARAFDQLEAAVEAGEEVVRGEYPADPSRRASTSRHVSARLYTRARWSLDPLDLLPPGSFGRELAMVALARYLKQAS